MNFQVSILKVLAGYPNGLAKLVDLKHDLEILGASGTDWAARTCRLGAVFPNPNIFSLGFVERYSFGWRLTKKGLIAIEMMEEIAATVPIGRAARQRMPLCIPEQPLASEVDGVTIGRLPSITPMGRRSQFAVLQGGKFEAA